MAASADADRKKRQRKADRKRRKDEGKRERRLCNLGSLPGPRNNGTRRNLENKKRRSPKNLSDRLLSAPVPGNFLLSIRLMNMKSEGDGDLFKVSLDFIKNYWGLY